MTNIPPPDPRSSPLGFDELIGIVVAFAVIGTIFVGVLRQKDKGFSLGNVSPLTPVPASPSPTASPTLGGLSTTREPNPLLPAPTEVAPSTSAPQATPSASARVSQVVPLAVVSPAAVSSKPVATKPSPPAKTVSFPDVPQVFWARPYIETLAKRGILTGFQDGTFRPNQPVTRAEFAAQLQKAFDQKVVVPAPNYKDVPNKLWASSAIQEVTRSGFLRGYPGNVFRPNQRISKVEALVALTKGLGLTSTAASNQTLKVYQDAKKIPKYATNVVAVATKSGLVVNYPTRQKLDPNKTLTRAEAAALTYQGMVQAGKAPAITSEYVAQP
ncbi:MAG: S-layer homology domain-containing protein [Cyanobacteriota bacterium]|nr:S-layer homology domain-containing protein [Cyanobacteriota bacterium]